MFGKTFAYCQTGEGALHGCLKMSRWDLTNTDIIMFLPLFFGWHLLNCFYVTMTLVTENQIAGCCFSSPWKPSVCSFASHHNCLDIIGFSIMLSLCASVVFEGFWWKKFCCKSFFYITEKSLNLYLKQKYPTFFFLFQKIHSLNVWVFFCFGFKLSDIVQCMIVQWKCITEINSCPLEEYRYGWEQYALYNQ